MKRVHYFNGQLLGAADFQTEQDYLLDKQRRLNLRTHGPGIVSGLSVSVEPDGVHVQPGVAIDPRGNEIVVDAPQVLPLPPGTPCVFLVLAYTETFTDDAPMIGEDQATSPTRVEDGFKLEYAPESSRGAEDRIELACLTNVDGQWTLESPGLGSLWKIGVVLFAVAALCCHYSCSRLRNRATVVS